MENFKTTTVKEDTVFDNEHTNYITGLYSKAKAIYKKAEQTGNTTDADEDEVLRIQLEFRKDGNKKGDLFCQKAISIIYEKRGDRATDLKGKMSFLERAHDSINECIVQAQQMRWKQPSLLKRQGIIKSKLGNVLHEMNDHYNANVLESDAFKIFGKMLDENPAYAEGHLEIASASLNKMKWSARKILAELNKAENLFNHPKHTKHIPNDTELGEYKFRIAQMRNSINAILAVAV